MADRQLRLFAHAKPLLERMGADFFCAAPRRPGVYVMCGRAGEILYVGQSGNLRARLNCYKNANPDTLPRRIVRLIHSVASITWEECASARLARVRENELLRLHRPKFNRVNTYPQAYGFIGSIAGAQQLTLFRLREASLSQNEHRGLLRDSGGQNFRTNVYGPFKGGALYGFASLLRLLWSALYQPQSPFDLPRQLLTPKPPSQFSIEFSYGGASSEALDWPSQLHAYLAGGSRALVQQLASVLQSERLALFHRNLIQADLDTLDWFYETGPARIQRLKREHGLDEGLIAKEELDDLIALSSTPRASKIRPFPVPDSPRRIKLNLGPQPQPGRTAEDASAP